jgi:hypothetical protein
MTSLSSLSGGGLQAPSRSATGQSQGGGIRAQSGSPKAAAVAPFAVSKSLVASTCGFRCKFRT